MKTFFTADLHFGHENVIRFDSRPFASVEEMDTTLIQRWNQKVTRGDLVYVLGDMIWGAKADYVEKILSSLNGTIVLIKGNHDRFAKSPIAKKLLSGIKDYDEIPVRLENAELKRVILSHYFMPFYNGHFHGSILLHGHSHNSQEHQEELLVEQNLKEKGYSLSIHNVGCMLWNYEPVTLDEILTKDSDDAKNRFESR